MSVEPLSIVMAVCSMSLLAISFSILYYILRIATKILSEGGMLNL
jgi:hypothetical protein